MATSSIVRKTGVKRPCWLAPLGVWVLGFFWLLAIFRLAEFINPDPLIDGFRIRDETSDTAWQTLRLWELWMVGPRALWLSHVYPPLYDGIRWLLMQPEVVAGGSPSIIAVDQRLYWFNALLFGLVSMVVYLWIRDLTKSGWWALGGAIVWMALPSSIAFMTLMNQTGLAIAAMAIAFYLLYRFLRTRSASYGIAFFAALLVASLTRNVVQTHVFVIIVIAAFAFFFMGKPKTWKTGVSYLLLIVGIALWPLRAYFMYSTFDVSTHTGYNRAGALWIHPLTVKEPTWPANIIQNGTALSSGWNTQETLRDNYRLGSAANEMMLERPLEALTRLWDSAQITLPVMFRSVYVQWENAFILNFPPARFLDAVFSGWSFPLIVVVAAVILLLRAVRLGDIKVVVRYGWFAIFWVIIAIPVLFSNRYWPEDQVVPVHSEADRLRGLIDVPVLVLVVFALFIAVQWIRRNLSLGSRKTEIPSSHLR